MRKSASGPVTARPLKLWQDHSPAGEVRIEIVPLIDVIFCILTFFILAAVGLSRQQAISLDLPKANTGKPQVREMLVVSLDNLGQLYVEQQPVTRDRLSAILKNYQLLNPSGLMVLHASRESRYEEVVSVLDMLRSVGGDRVALATLPRGTVENLQPTPSLNNGGLNGLPGSNFDLNAPLPSGTPNSLTPSTPNLPAPPPLPGGGSELPEDTN
ncbi:MAG: biopolymer transporter ExbD [Chloroflexaceae bacterium]|nr:biopolymer transporter ExbD [Chloroflexaceae bacterium]